MLPALIEYAFAKLNRARIEDNRTGNSSILIISAFAIILKVEIKLENLLTRERILSFNFWSIENSKSYELSSLSQRRRKSNIEIDLIRIQREQPCGKIHYSFFISIFIMQNGQHLISSR